MTLRKTDIDRLETREKRYAVLDGNGLSIEVLPSGKKIWRLRFQHKGKQSTITLGEYPTLGIKEARQAALLRRSDMITTPTGSPGKEFSYYAQKWLARHIINKVAPVTRDTIVSRLENHILPAIGDMPVTEIKPQDINRLLQRLQAAGKVPTARRCLSVIGRVFRYAISEGEEIADPSAALSERIEVHKVEHFSAIVTKPEAARLMRNLDEYPNMITRMALLFTAYTFCRSNEVRFAVWDEFNLDDKVWRIPAERMKARRPHIVPLSRQVIEILERMRLITDGRKYVFPSQHDFNNPMSENCMLKALRRWYSKEMMTPHGFRATASTLLNESGLWHTNAIELQLAHSDTDTTRASYNYAKLLPERTAMMQWYADLLDSLKAGAPAPAKPQFATID